MALVVSNLSYERKPWMLRDYLRDDMSSCSSNGFRSFPRKQCCVAVKNIIESETRKMKKQPKKMLSRNQRVSSALQRASLAVIKAVKLLPFNSTTAVTNGSNSGGGRRFLTRSFSKKIFKRSFFWKKSSEEKEVVVVVEDEGECDEIERWISSCGSATEKYVPLDLSNDTSVTNISNFSNSNRNSNNSSDGKSSSECWSDITFTSDYLPSLGEKHVVKKHAGCDEEEVVSKSVGGLVGPDSTQDTAVNKNHWCNEKGQTEHLSPISVMDFPNNDDGSQSPFTLRVSRLKGTKERLMEKLGRFESLAAGLGLDPVNLESLMLSEDTKDHSPKGSIQSCSTPSFILSSESESEVGEKEEEEDDESQVDEEVEEDDESQVDEEEERVQHLLNTIRFKKANYKIECDNLLLSFLRENVDQKSDDSLLKCSDDWLNGHYDTLILGWEVKDKRQAYIRDMEERGRWPKDCKSETEDVATELGNEVLTTLIQEVMLELC